MPNQLYKYTIVLVQNMGKYSGHTLRLIFAASFGSLTYGYSSGLAGSATALPSFVAYFDYESSTAKADIFNGIYSGAGLIGCLVGGVFSERFGRRWAIFIGSCLGVIGGAIMTGAVNIVMIYVSRAILGLCVGMLVMLIPLWQTEIAPAEGRGLLVSMHGVMILLGYSLAMWISYGFYFASNEKAWRAIFGFQMLWPMCLGVFVWTLPESPRWLIENNKYESARESLQKLDPNTAEKGLNDMIQGIASENQNSSWSSLVKVKSYRKRLLLGLLIMIGGQSTGTVVVANCGPIIYGALGFSSEKQILINACYISTAVLWNYVSALLIDRVGRKTLLMIGFFGSGVFVMSMESIMVARFAGTTNVAGNRAAVFFIFLHVFFYGGTSDATTYVYNTEIWPTHIRSKGSSLSVSGLFVGLLAYTTGASTAMSNIGWKYYIVFICLSFCSTIMLYLYMPETKNLRLEEIGALFGDASEDHEDAVHIVDGVSTSDNSSPSRLDLDVKHKLSEV